MLTRTHSTRAEMENQLKCTDPGRQISGRKQNGSHTQWGMTMLQAREKNLGIWGNMGEYGTHNQLRQTPGVFTCGILNVNPIEKES